MTKAAALRLYGANHKICVMLLQRGENEHKISEPNPFTKKNSGVAIQVNDWTFDEIGEYIYTHIYIYSISNMNQDFLYIDFEKKNVN